MTTREVSRELGVSIKTLQFWVREGWIDGVIVTGEGTQRRIKWTPDGIEQARRLKGRSENGSAVAEIYGSDLLATMNRARQQKDYQGAEDVIVASSKVARMFRSDTPLSEVLRRMQGDFFILLR